MDLNYFYFNGVENGSPNPSQSMFIYQELFAYYK